MSESDCSRCEARHMTSRDVCQRCAEASVGATEAQREATRLLAAAWAVEWARRLAEAGPDLPFEEARDETI